LDFFKKDYERKSKKLGGGVGTSEKRAEGKTVIKVSLYWMKAGRILNPEGGIQRTRLLGKRLERELSGWQPAA
jgi:hypothetical protein